MRILPINIQHTSFKGIKPEYVNKSGYIVKPLEQDPRQSDMRAAVEMSEMKKGEKGKKSTVYLWGDNKIIKKLNTESSKTFAQDSEPVLLDRLQEYGLNGPLNEHGKYAFITPTGTQYLVTTKAKGRTIKNSPNVMQMFNLQTLYKGFVKLDQGKQTLCKDDKTGEMTLSVIRPLHNNLNTVNERFDENNAGISGFENTEFINLTDFMKKVDETDNFKTLDPNAAEVGFAPSNMRNFEYKGLYEGLNKARLSRTLFRAHFYAKADYYGQMFIWLRDNAELTTGSQSKQIEQQALRCASQSFVLARAFGNEENFPGVEEAEARKIQIARWLYEMSDSNEVDNAKINYNQVKEYFQDTKAFMQAHLEKAQEDNHTKRTEYYQSNVELIDAWDGISEYIDESLKEPDPLTMSSKEYEKAKIHHDKFVAKSTDEPIETFEKVVKYNRR